MARIAEVVADYYGVSMDDVYGSRKFRFTWVRGVVCWIAHKQGLTFEDIGREFGHDRGSAFKRSQRVETIRARDEVVRQETDELLLKVSQ